MWLLKFGNMYLQAVTKQNVFELCPTPTATPPILFHDGYNNPYFLATTASGFQHQRLHDLMIVLIL